MFRALINVRPSHLTDSSLFDFAALMTEQIKFDGNPVQLGDAN